MTEAYLLLGSNLGNREQYLQQARQALEARAGTICAASGIYETAAWGVEDQQAFLNQILKIRTKLEPEALLQAALAAEQDLGRVRLKKWGERVIDIDILFYGNRVLQTEALTIPHPQLHRRHFTLVPLAEIAPDLMHPIFRKTIQQLLDECPDKLEVKLFNRK